MLMGGVRKKTPWGGIIVPPVREDEQQPTYGIPGQLPDIKNDAIDMPSYGESLPKPKFNPWDIVGAAGDALASYGGMGTPYRDMQQQKLATEASEQQYQRRRASEWSDFIRKSEYERNNPKPQNPHYFETNDGSQGMIDPATGEPRIVYKDPTPKVSYQRVDNGDGTFTMVPVVNGQIMPQGGAKVPRRLQPGQKYVPEGGPTQPASGGFPEQGIAR